MSSNLLRLSSPFVTASGVQRLKAGLANPRLKIEMIIAIDPFAVVMGALDLEAITALLRSHSDRVRVFSVKSLHAKVVIADEREASVGSANLTHRGYTSNIELGILVRRKEEVRALANEFDGWKGHRKCLSVDELEDFARLIDAKLGHLKDILRFEVDGVEAFPDFSKTYPELMSELVQSIPPRKGMSIAAFEESLAGRRGNKEDDLIRVRRRIFMTRLGLVRVDAERVFRGPNSKFADDKRALSRILRREYPQVDEFLNLIIKGRWTSHKLQAVVYERGSNALRVQWPAIKRWCVQLDLVTVTRGGPKSIREFERAKRRATKSPIGTLTSSSPP